MIFRPQRAQQWQQRRVVATGFSPALSRIILGMVVSGRRRKVLLNS